MLFDIIFRHTLLIFNWTYTRRLTSGYYANKGNKQKRNETKQTNNEQEKRGFDANSLTEVGLSKPTEPITESFRYRIHQRKLSVEVPLTMYTPRDKPTYTSLCNLFLFVCQGSHRIIEHIQCFISYLDWPCLDGPLTTFVQCTCIDPFSLYVEEFFLPDDKMAIPQTKHQRTVAVAAALVAGITGHLHNDVIWLQLPKCISLQSL